MAKIIDFARNAGSFNTLVRAVEAAGLADTLSGPGPFTVFAPTDKAFAKLPAGTIEGLLADKAKLTAVLTYHVVPGKVVAKEASQMSSARTVNGQTIRLEMSDGNLMLDGTTKVIEADIAADNGVIHVIDSVLLPR